MSRPILLDGITIQLAGELLFDIGSHPKDRARSHILYRLALEDFSFAILFGESLGRIGSLGERNNSRPGQTLLDYDSGNGQLFKHTLTPAAHPPEALLKSEAARRALATELHLLGDLDVKHWVPYIRLEGATNLSAAPVLSDAPSPGARYLFPRRKEIYMSDVELQEKIDHVRFIPALIEALQTEFVNRLQDDFQEFVERVLLTHFAISHWYEGGEAANYIRLPFKTRSSVRERAVSDSLGEKRDLGVHRGTKQIRLSIIRSVVPEVLSNVGSFQREDLYHMLVDSRDFYKEHRKHLSSIDFYSRRENYNEKEINIACEYLAKALSGRETRTAFKTDAPKMTNFLLPLQTEIRRHMYPQNLFEYFPELAGSEEIHRRTPVLIRPKNDDTKGDDQSDMVGVLSYDVALSYASEDERLAQDIAAKLRMSGFGVFLYSLEQATLLGRNLFDALSEIFGQRTHFFMALISKNYTAKVWPSFEYLVAQEKAQLLKQQDFILPVLLDDAQLLGMSPLTVRFDLRSNSVDDLVSLVSEKLRRVSLANVGLSPDRSTRVD